MRIKIASDIHGAYDDLVALLDPEDLCFLLGDYINIIDYSDRSGLLAEFVDRETIERVIELTARNELAEAKKVMVKTAAGIEDLFGKIAARTDECYRDLFAKIPCEVYLINGNVDFPPQLRANLRPHLHYIEETHVLDLNGARIGFVNGSPKMNYSFGMPGEIQPEEFERRLVALGPVEHLFVHCPPAIEDLCFDRLANRDEGGSEALLRYVETHAPKTVHFGHVHEPRRREMDYDRTRFINCGPFRDEKRLTILELPDDAA